MAMKDLIIGAASNYTYDQVKFWINSIKKTGFDGDVVLVVTNMKNTDLEKIAEQGVQILAYGYKDAEGSYVSHSSLAPHVERFFHIWNYLVQCQPYRFVIVTDVRDVVFQKDPIGYLGYTLDYEKKMVAAGEGLKYKDEPWGNQNYLQTFGPHFYERMKDLEIFNVGVLAGKHPVINDLLLMLFQMSINRPIPVVDQAVYNFLLRLNFTHAGTEFEPNDSEWAVNLGTTLPAIASGAGDIGMRNDPTAQILYQSKYLAEQPVIENGIVYNSKKEKVCIVHQYDRVAGLKEEMEKLYG
jgi:hypothetical protein